MTGAPHGPFDEAEPEEQLSNRKFINRILFGAHECLAYVPIGLLSGLGFDTATEMSLLVLRRRAPLLQPAVVGHPYVADPVRRRNGPVRHRRRLQGSG